MTVSLSRRRFLATTLVGLATPAIASASATRRNASSFRMQDWREHFDDLGVGTALMV